MFRKPKRKAKQGLRRKEEVDDHAEKETEAAHAEEADDETSELLSEAKKRVKLTSNKPTASSTQSPSSSSAILHSYQQSDESSRLTNADLATSAAQHHSESLIRSYPKDNQESAETTATTEVGKGADGIFRNKQRNKFHAGPIKAAQNVRVTARFDYEPNICKDYKETGFCGFGDTCIYLHDRGDTMTGWQLEQQWEEQQRKKKEQQQKEMQRFVDTMSEGAMKTDADEVIPTDGLPFACHLCREYFKNPVVTNCNHYFCENCIMNHVRTTSEQCPICSKETGSVFNQPTKLMAKKRKVLGISKAKAENSWEEFAKAFAKQTSGEDA